MKEQINNREPADYQGESPVKKNRSVNGLAVILRLSAKGNYYDLPQVNAVKYYKNGSPIRPIRHGRKHQWDNG